MRVTFDTIKVCRTVRVMCPDGKRRKRSKTFTHTVNPFNKNADGSIKTKAQVYADINAAADAWVAEMTGWQSGA